MRYKFTPKDMLEMDLWACFYKFIDIRFFIYSGIQQEPVPEPETFFKFGGAEAEVFFLNL